MAIPSFRMFYFLPYKHIAMKPIRISADLTPVC